MMHRAKTLTLALATLPMLFGTAAHAKTDMLRCQARTLRCESQFYRCLSRCEHRAARARKSPADVQAKCEARCDTVYSNRMAHIESHPPCQDVVVTPDPMLCEAFYLAADARFNTCQASCAARSNSTSCLSSCTTRHDTALDQLNVNPICGEGRFSSSTPPVQN